MPEINLDPLLIPARHVPDLSVDSEGLMFQWPGEAWEIMEDASGLFVVDQQLVSRVELNLNRHQLKVSELPWREEAFAPDNFHIRSIRPLMEGYLLTAENREGDHLLIHLLDLESGDMKPLTADPGEPPLHLISPDGSKVAYQSFERGGIITYHTVTGRQTVLTAIEPDIFCGQWTDQMCFSPLGGYATVQRLDCETGRPVQFTTYGADTGRVIHQPLPGTSPRWDSGDRKIAFILHPTAPSGPSPGDDRTQLAVYSLDRRELHFLNRLPEGFHLQGAPVFSPNEQFLLYAMAHGEELRLVMYHLERYVQQTLPVPEPGYLTVAEDLWHFEYPLLGVPVVMDDVSALVLYDDENKLMEFQVPLTPWEDAWRQTRYLVSDGGRGFYYLAENQVMHTAGGSHRLIMTLPSGSRLEDVRVLSGRLAVIMRSGQGERTVAFPGL